MSRDEIREIQDPLFARVNRSGKSRPQRASSGGSTGSGAPSGSGGDGGGGSSKWPYVLAGALVVTVGIFGYLFYLSQQRLEALNSELITSKTQLAQELQTSQDKIGTLQEGLSQSEAKIQEQRQQLGRYRGQVASLKNETEELKSEQKEQSRNLEVINLKKADREQVEQLEGQTQQIAQDVDQAKAGITDLRDTTARNQSAIDSNRADISKVGGRADSINSDLSAFKDSFAREIFKFELEKKGARMEVFDVSLGLRKTDVKKQRYNLEIFADGRKITKKNQHVNEPIKFYVEGAAKEYEVVVTKVGKDFVVGQLSVPKKGANANSSVSG